MGWSEVTAWLIRAAADWIPAMREGSWRLERLGLRKERACWAVVILRLMSSLAMRGCWRIWMAKSCGSGAGWAGESQLREIQFFCKPV